MKKCFLLSLLAISLSVPSWACGGWVRPDYYLFSVYNRCLSSNTVNTDSYWRDYISAKEDTYGDCYDVPACTFEQFDTIPSKSSKVLATARRKNDKATLDYIKLLSAFQAAYSINPWDYPSPEELDVMKGRLVDIRSKALAAAKAGGSYGPQYHLMVMRCNMLRDEHQANITYWGSVASKLGDSPYKTLMKGAYARALLKSGDLKQAMRVYDQLGDYNSIKWAMRKTRDLKAIKEVYNDDPNSPALLVLVQDYVNNLQDAQEAVKGGYFGNSSDDDENKIDPKAYFEEVQQFIAFAAFVAEEGRSQVPAMWKAAQGMANFHMGRAELAEKQLAEAMNLKGTQRMHDNARACRLIAMTATAKQGNEALNFFANELKWLDQLANDPEKCADGGCNEHYNEVMLRATEDYLMPMLKKWGKPEAALAMLGVAEAYKTSYYDPFSDKNTDYKSLMFRYGEFGGAINDASAEELSNLMAYLKSTSDNELEAWLKSNVQCSPDMENDLIGTKLLRQGEFADAIPYLEKVPYAFLSKQSIAPYMQQRDFYKERWFTRQKEVDESDENIVLNKNQKLNFCREMLRLHGIVNNRSNGKKMRQQALYQMANLLFQAGKNGDCWYITHYGWSSADNGYSDNEMNFDAKALDCLREITADPTSALYPKALHAAAYITQEAYGSCFIKENDWDVKSKVIGLKREGANYEAMCDMSKYLKSHKKTPAYISNCGYYKLFKRLY